MKIKTRVGYRLSNNFQLRTWVYKNLNHKTLASQAEGSIETKAGRLVGLADCYAIIALADNATFLLAVNRIAAFRSHSAIITNMIISCRGSNGRASAP